MKRPRLYRVTLIVEDIYAKPMGVKAIRRNIMDAVNSAEFAPLAREVASVGRVKFCARCGEIIRPQEFSSGKFCDDCFAEIQQEMEESRCSLKQKRP